MFRGLLILTILILPTVMQGQLSLMTYNIRYNTPNDQENWWEYRKSDVADLINYYAPDIIGIQEGLHAQVSYLDSTLVDYDYVGVGRDDGKNKGEFTAIFYNSNKVEPISNTTYWLSETPDKVSVGWDASMERITTFAIFEDKVSGDSLFVFNCHFDHRGPIARENSAKLINELIEKKGLLNERIIVMGDLNCLPDDTPIQAFETLLDDTYHISEQKPYGPKGTWCSFDTQTKPVRRIDYILSRNNKVLRYANIDDRRPNGLNVSDHLPVFVVVESSQ